MKKYYNYSKINGIICTIKTIQNKRIKTDILYRLLVTIQQEDAFTAYSVRRCSMNKQKSICEANLEWIFVCNYEGTE